MRRPLTPALALAVLGAVAPAAAQDQIRRGVTVVEDRADGKVRVRVSRVDPGDVGDRMGLRAGDWVRKINEHRVDSARTFREALRAASVELYYQRGPVVYRAAASWEISTSPGDGRPPPRSRAPDVSRGRRVVADLGVRLTEDASGARAQVAEVPAGSVGDRMGLRAGDRIRTANSRSVTSVAALRDALLSGPELADPEAEVVIQRGEDFFRAAAAWEWDRRSGYALRVTAAEPAEPMVPDLGVRLSEDGRAGVTAGRVTPGTLGDRMGLREGDVIRAVIPDRGAPAPVGSVRPLHAAFDGPGVTLVLQRGGEFFRAGAARVTDPGGANRVRVSAAAPAPPPLLDLGVRLSEDRRAGRVRIAAVARGGPGDRMGLRAGDRIDTVGGRLIGSVEDWQSALVASEADVVIRRGRTSYRAAAGWASEDGPGSKPQLLVTPAAKHSPSPGGSR